MRRFISIAIFTSIMITLALTVREWHGSPDEGAHATLAAASAAAHKRAPVANRARFRPLRPVIAESASPPHRQAAAAVQAPKPHELEPATPVEEPAAAEECETAAPPESPYPSPAQEHLESIGQRVRGLAEVIELEPQVARAHTPHMAEHVQGERRLWDEARVYGDSDIDREQAAKLAQDTLVAIRQAPELGDGIARVVERIFTPMVRDPRTPVDPSQMTIGISELRSLAGLPVPQQQ